MAGVIYTAIFGAAGDTLRQTPPTSDRYVAFVDPSELLRGNVHNGWQLRPAFCPDPSPRRRARLHKSRPDLLFPDAEWSLWMDGSLQLKQLPATLPALLADSDVCVFTHRYRDCLYQEAQECQRLELDDRRVIQRQVDRYRAEGYPEHYGLSETTAVLRRHTPATKELNWLWMSELRIGSLRDQLSFDYVCWRCGIAPARFPGRLDRCKYFRYWRHRRSGPRKHQ